MALAGRMIAHTRFAFHGQKTSVPQTATAAMDDLAQIPLPEHSGNVGDDLLRRSCLRCHLQTSGSQRDGEHRGAGCSACHSVRSNHSEKRPVHHLVVRDVGSTACLKCHNAQHVGADFVGLFEKDFERGFRSPVRSGHQVPRLYGSEHHRLLPDVHFRRGLGCTDCHVQEEIHGSGIVRRTPYPLPVISCEGCHVRGDHPRMKSEDGGPGLMARSGRHTVPTRNDRSVPHRVQAHRDRLRCSACHAAWSFQDYGFHLMREQRADYWKWATLAAQNDPQIQELLMRNVGTEAELIPPAMGAQPAKPEGEWEPPTMRDWLNGEIRPGAWFRGYTDRRWAQPPLGRDHRGKVSVMRPMHQYVVSVVDASGTVLMDSEIPVTGAGSPAALMNPYAPHTINERGRSCHECHGDPKAVGLGEGRIAIGGKGFVPLFRTGLKLEHGTVPWDALLTSDLRSAQRSSHPGAGPLDAETAKKLLNPSAAWKVLWYRYLSPQQPANP
jgi:hypothetical protein